MCESKLFQNLREHEKFAATVSGPTVFTDRGGLLRIDPRTQERRLPAVHVVLRVAGQLQGAIILVHIPAGADAGQRYGHTSSQEWLIIHSVSHPNKQAERISWKGLIKTNPNTLWNPASYTQCSPIVSDPSGRRDINADIWKY